MRDKSPSVYLIDSSVTGLLIYVFNSDGESAV